MKQIFPPNKTLLRQQGDAMHRGDNCIHPGIGMRGATTKDLIVLSGTKYACFCKWAYIYASVVWWYKSWYMYGVNGVHFQVCVYIALAWLVYVCDS